MSAALRLSGFGSIPPDTAVYRHTDAVKRVLLGIDIGEEDVRRARREGFDLVVAHHPFEKTGFLRVLARHEALMVENGVAPERAREASRRNAEMYEKRVAALPPDDSAHRLAALAEDLGIGLMNIHLPCDEVGRLTLKRIAGSVGFAGSVADLVEKFRAVPELAALPEEVEIVCGSPDAPLGKTVVIHAAGTNGGYHVADALFESGVGTVVYIHLPERHRELLQAEGRGNLVLTGHYGSDSLGINPLVDFLEDAGIEVTCCNNMIRVRRQAPKIRVNTSR